MSFVQFFRIFWARRAIILVAVFGCLVAALLTIKILPSRYEAQSRVMLDTLKPDPVTGLGMGAGQVRGYVKTQTELIKDYRVAGRVVDALGWTQSPLYLGAYARRGKNDNRDFRRWVAQQVIDNTDTRLIDASNILEIAYTSSSAESARVIADAIRQAYIDQTLAFKRDAAATTAAWFQQQTQKLRADLTTAENNKAAFERANGIVLGSDNTDPQEARLRSLAVAQLTPAPIGAAGVAAPSPMETQLAGIDAQIAIAAKTLGPNHPDLLAMQRQRGVVAAAAGREAAALRSAAAAANRGVTGPSINALYSQQQAKVLSERGKVAEAQRLQNDVTILRDQYLKTAARTADLDQQSQSTESGMTLLGSAVAPNSPSFPKIPLILFGSIGLGLALGILCSLLVELLSRRVRGIEDLSLKGIPVIGVMSREPVRALGLRRVPLLLGFQPRQA